MAKSKPALGHNKPPHKHKSHVQHLTFDSTCLENGRYNKKTGHLRLTFTDGTSFSYDGVDPSDIEDILDAESQGKAFNEILR